VFLFYFNKIRWVMCRQMIGCCKTSVLQTDRIVGAPFSFLFCCFFFFFIFIFLKVRFIAHLPSFHHRHPTCLSSTLVVLIRQEITIRVVSNRGGQTNHYNRPKMVTRLPPRYAKGVLSQASPPLRSYMHDHSPFFL
jgi:hypothetical protein